MNNMEYKELIDSMVKHQIKNTFKLTLNLISHRATDMSKQLTMINKDARVEYLNSVLWNRAMDIEDDEESETLKSYISVMVFDNSMPATPPQYSDFKMNSVDYNIPKLRMIGELNFLQTSVLYGQPGERRFVQRYFGGSTPNDTGLMPINYILRRCEDARASTIMKLSYDNYRHSMDNLDNNPVHLNRRYEVMYIRFILYLYLNKPASMSGNIMVSALPPANTRRYICEYNNVKSMISMNNHNTPQLGDLYNDRQNTGLKPISVAGFKRLCVDRELIAVWKSGPVHQPLHIS